MENALDFFREVFGWHISDRVVSGDWGQARFVLSDVNSTFSVQLSDYKDQSDRPATYSATHLAVNVVNAELVAKTILSWAKVQDVKCHIKKANPEGSKWFVRLNEWFTFEFELITQP
jgi:hypothetical protein